MYVVISSEKRGKTLVLHQRITHQLVIGEIFHDAGAHRGVIHVNFGHKARRELMLQLQDFRFNAVAVQGNPHGCRNTQRLSRVLDNDGVPLASQTRNT